MSEPVVKCVVGMTGSGKTTKAESLVVDLPRVLYFDTLAEDYSDGVTFDRRADLEAFWRQRYQGPFRLIYRPDDPCEDFGRFCQLVYECGQMAFVVDEADMYCRNGKCLDREFTNLIGKGRHHDVTLICCTQAPKKLADFLRSQAHEWFVFMTKEPAHVRYLRDRFGGLVNDEDITSLRQFEYLHFRDYGPDGTPAVEKCKDDIVNGFTHFEPLAHASGSRTGSDNDDGS